MTATTDGGDGSRVSVSADVYWRYDAAPRGAKVFLLTKGGVAVEGQWRDGGDYIAWHPLFRRDHTLERRRWGETHYGLVA